MHRGDLGRELHARRRQAEEDEEQLHDEGRVADQLDVACRRSSAATPARCARAQAQATPSAMPISAGDRPSGPSVHATPLASSGHSARTAPKSNAITHARCVSERQVAGRPAEPLLATSCRASPSFLASAMISLTLARSLSSPLATPMKFGAVLQQQLVLGARAAGSSPSCCRPPRRWWR